MVQERVEDMFCQWEKEPRSSSNYSYDTEGVLDLSLPKNHNFSGSESTSSSDVGRSSVSVAASSSFVDADISSPESDNNNSAWSLVSRYRVYTSDSEKSTEIQEEAKEKQDDSARNIKKQRLSSPEPEVNDQIYEYIRPEDNDTYGGPDNQPIRCTNNGVVISLHDEVLWNAFRKVGTEMIINRGGRRMFPHVILSVVGLNPSATYSISMEIALADDRRFKYVNNQWLGMGMADPGPGAKTVAHPDSPNSGAYWMKSRISFSKVRLTNNKDSSDENILLLSMHKYKVVIKIRNESLPYDNMTSFVFDESTFVAVTAYQNNKITQLKIQNNPFAKAFRDAPHKQKGEGKRKSSEKQQNLDNDFSVFQVSGNKKQHLTSTPKDKPRSQLPYPGWDPWYMNGFGQRFSVPGAPFYDVTGPRYDRYIDPRVYMNPALMAHLSYLPFLSMSHQLGQRLPTSQISGMLSEDTSSSGLSDLPNSSSDDTDENKTSTDIDSASKSSDDYT